MVKNNHEESIHSQGKNESGLPESLPGGNQEATVKTNVVCAAEKSGLQEKPLSLQVLESWRGQAL